MAASAAELELGELEKFLSSVINQSSLHHFEAKISHEVLSGELLDLVDKLAARPRYVTAYSSKRSLREKLLCLSRRSQRKINANEIDFVDFHSQARLILLS